jgi:mRNA-degrading endonuclease RelE of RelBE toxin-antitoxin system
MFEFIETPLFTKEAERYLDDDDYQALQVYLDRNPDAGDVVRGTGGVRKLRWGAAGRGKRGGLRVIYLLRVRQEQIWLLTLYGKNVRDTIPANVLSAMRKEIEDA